MGANLRNGNPLMIDHTPSSAVEAGDLVKLNEIVCVAHSIIEADALGALAFPSGNAVYELTLKENAVFVAGEAVFVDPTSFEADPAESDFFGYATHAADETAGDTIVYAVHCLQGLNAQS